MSTNFNAKIGKRYNSPISRDIHVSTIQFTSQNIELWRTALDHARSEIMPKRKDLMEMYENIILDGHLQSVMGKRVRALSNKKIVFELKDQDGALDENVREHIVQTPWFHQTTKYAAEAKSFGFSLVEWIVKGGIIVDTELMPRKVVRPEHSFMQWGEYDYHQGINFIQDRKYSKRLIGFGDKLNLGMLATAAQYVIYKRGGIGDWAQHAELFGKPFIDATYPIFDTNSRTKMNESLKIMGGNGHIVRPDTTNLNILDNNGSGKAELYELLVRLCDEQISKLYVGQTMTTDNGSSHSQSETHKEVEDEIMLADMIEYEYDLNWRMADKLRALGYTIPEGHFRFDVSKQLPLDKLIDIAIKVDSKAPIAEEYWYKTFGVMKPDAAELNKRLKQIEADKKATADLKLSDAKPPTADIKKAEPNKKVIPKQTKAEEEEPKK